MRLPSPVHIETICCIARLKTFTAAALCLHTTQSAISARVRDVEDMLGVQLFQRNGRSVELTHEGIRFVESAEPTLRDLQMLVSSYKTPNEPSGRIRIGAGSSSMSSVASMLRHLGEQMPQLTFELVNSPAGDLVRELEVGMLDLAAFTVPSSELDERKVFSRSMGYETLRWLIAPALLRPAGGGRPSMQELLDRHPLWCVPKPTGHFELSLGSIKDRGGRFRQLNTSNNMAATVEIIVAGGGIGLLTDKLTHYQRAAGHLVEAFEDLMPPPLEFFIACARERRTQVLDRLMDAAIRHSGFRPNP